MTVTGLHNTTSPLREDACAAAGAGGVDGGRACQEALGVEGGDAEAADDLGWNSAGREHVGRAPRGHGAGGGFAVVNVDEDDAGGAGRVVVAVDAVARPAAVTLSSPAQAVAVAAAPPVPSIW